MHEYTDTMYSHKLSYCTIQHHKKKKRKKNNKVSLPWLVIPIHSAGKFWVSHTHRKRFQQSAVLSASVVKSFKHIHKDKASSAAAAAAVAVGAGGSLATLTVVLLY